MSDDTIAYTVEDVAALHRMLDEEEQKAPIAVNPQVSLEEQADDAR